MTQEERNEILKAAKCVYLACDASVADDISNKLLSMLSAVNEAETGRDHYKSIAEAYQAAAPLEKVQEWAKAADERLNERVSLLDEIIKENPNIACCTCKLGDMVYWISPFNTCIYQGIIFAIKTSKFGIDLEISQSEKNHLTVKRELEKCFFTREEAEAALREREGE